MLIPGAIYADLVVNTAAECSHRICRRLCLATPAALLAAIAELHDHVMLVFGTDVLSVDVSQCTPAHFAAVRASPLHFVNVCGKVTHCRASHVLNPAVLPLVVSVRFHSLHMHRMIAAQRDLSEFHRCPGHREPCRRHSAL